MEVVVVGEVEGGVVAVAARHLQQEGGPFHLMEPVGADEGARVALQLGGGVPPADLARALEREHRAVRHEHHERRRAVQLADEAEVGERALEAEEGDDGDRVAAPPLLDQPDPHLVRDVGRQLLVLGDGELVEEGELPRAEEDLKGRTRREGNG